MLILMTARSSFGGGTELLRDGDPEGNVEKLKKMFA